MAREYKTQMEAARKGIVTPEIEKVAAKERMTVEELMPLVACGKVAIPANVNHKCLEPEGVGSMLRTKINVNLGVSRDCKDYDVEMQKVMSAVDLGAEAIMDLSSHGNTQPFIHFRLNVDRYRPCQYHAPDNGAMGIPGNQHLIPRGQGAQQHGMNSPRSTVDDKQCVLRSPQLSCQSLCRLDAALRLMQVVQLLHKGNLLPQPFLRNQLPQKPMSSQPLLVAGSMKSKGAVPCIFLHCMRNRRLILIQHVFCTFI